MFNLTEKHSKEQSHTPTNADVTNQNNSNSNSKNSDPKDQLVYNEDYMQTGIWIRGSENTGYFATIGNHRVSDIMEDADTVRTQLDSTDWRTLLSVICVLAENITKSFLNNSNQ